jgi:hypothetical protein
MADNGEAVVKKVLSEAQLAARKANAQKSTGPRNTARTRYNAVSHGLRAEHVLPGESQAAYKERLEQWMEDFAPANSAQRFLVQRAVDLSVKIERGDVVEEALALELILEAQNMADGGLEEVEKLAAELPETRAAALCKLRKTSAGCLWQLEKWRVLRQRLETHKRFCLTERTLVLQLQGKRPVDALRSDPVAVKWLTVLLGASYPPDYDKVQCFARELGLYPPSDMHVSEFNLRVAELAAAVPAQSQCLSLLQAYVAETILDLENHLEIIQELEQEKRAIALQRARIDLDERGKQVLRYQSSHRGSFEAALRRLDVLQNPRQPRPPGRPRKTRPEAPATTQGSGQPSASSEQSGSELGPGEITTEAQQTAVSPEQTSDSMTTAPVTTIETCTDAPIVNSAATTNEAKNDAGSKNSVATTNEAKNDAGSENSVATTNEAKDCAEAIDEFHAVLQTMGPGTPTRDELVAMGPELHEWMKTVLSARPAQRCSSAARAVPVVDQDTVLAGERAGEAGMVGGTRRPPPRAAP